MASVSGSGLSGSIFQIHDSEVRGHLDEVVRQSVEATLNGLLDAEADQLCRAGRYERSADRVVDELDYSKWKSEYGTQSTAADGNGNGIVDAADYVVWRDNLSPVPAKTANANLTPEPAASGLVSMAICTLMVLFGVWRRRARRLSAAALVVLSLTATHAHSLTIPFAEEFSTDVADCATLQITQCHMLQRTAPKVWTTDTSRR